MEFNRTGLTVLVAPAAEQRLRHWIGLARGEVSGLGTVIPHDDGLLVEDVFLLEQTCTGSHTELDDEAVAQLLVDLDGQGIDIGTVRLWWHSHGTMPAFWSNTDESCIEGLANDSYLVSLVSNKRAQDLVRVDLFHPFVATFDDLPLVIDVGDLGLRDQCEAEFREKVREVALVSRRLGRQVGTLAPAPFADPPWLRDEDDGHILVEPDAEDWWEDGGWSLHDDDQLLLQVDDPWGRALALEARP